MSLNIIVGESALLLPSPGQVGVPLSMAELVYIGKKNNLDLLLAMTETLLLDQNVGSDKLEEARGELKAAVDPFRAACDGLFKSQVRKTQYEQNHLWRCVTDCLGDLNVAIRLKRQQEGQAETEQVRQVELPEAEKVRQEKQESEPPSIWGRCC